LLASGHARFGEVARRLVAAIQTRAGQQALQTLAADPPTGLSPAAAHAAAVAAGGLLLGELCGYLSDAAQAVLIEASVYRQPVGAGAVSPRGQPGRPGAPAGLIAECAALGLLTVHPGSQPAAVSVHRWT